MSFNLDKLNELAKPRGKNAEAAAAFRRRNRQWLRMSQEIALAIRYHLRTSGITQKDLAEKMGVSPSYVGKVLKGQENLTLETIACFQEAVGCSLIEVAAPYADIADITPAMENSIHWGDLWNSTNAEFDLSCIIVPVRRNKKVASDKNIA